ncbi:MAG TPA: (deoxy)nucleoside triphosphate pyrophosphohydrolase [Pseudonocardiaceae bacterium]|jgi:8-oxo-dGTP diphosphatase|nr:(deoxy)nucleoside triphosphate pyrophosphohydrolase [Pseudonocardiaceae bacterium]
MIVTHRAVLPAPARTVAAVLAEPWLLRERLGLAGPAVAQLSAGQTVGSAWGRSPLGVRLPEWGRARLAVELADERGVLLTGASLGAAVGLAALVEPGPRPHPVPEMRRGSAAEAEVRRGSAVEPGVANAGLTCTVRVPGMTRRHGLALLDGLVDAVRGRARQLAQAPVVVGAAILDPAGRLLVQQRDWPAADAGRWEFPGGRVEPGESEPAAVARECMEELGVGLEVGGRVGPDLILPSGWLLRIYSASLTGGQPRAREHRAVRWVRAAELDGLDWLAADRVLVPRMRTLLAQPA